MKSDCRYECRKIAPSLENGEKKTFHIQYKMKNEKIQIKKFKFCGPDALEPAFEYPKPSLWIFTCDRFFCPSPRDMQVHFFSIDLFKNINIKINGSVHA